VVALSVAGVTNAVANGPEPGQEQVGEGAAAAGPPGSGYWLIGSDGGVRAYGVPDHGSLRIPPARPITGAAVTPGGGGYWLVGTDGGVFSFGDAAFFGSTGAIRLNRPIVGMAASPSGRGYWLVASDGGVFAFGDAGFYGSTGAIVLNQPIRGMSASPSGRGYRFVAADGGLFSFGDAAYAGSAAGRRLSDPIVGVAGSPTGNGYWLAGSSGAVYGYGDIRELHLPPPTQTGELQLPPPTQNGTPSESAPVVAIVAPPPRAAEEHHADAVAPASGTPPTSGPSAGPDPSGVAPATASDHPGRFEIALIGDTGYSAAQDQILLKTRTAISSRPYAFVVHDGDIKDPLAPCTGERLEYVHQVFDGFSVPLVYTPGDNEWSDCPDPAAQLAAIRQRFFAGDHSLGQRRIALTRQATFVENARWLVGNVVFATLNVPGPSGKSSRAGGLAQANVGWLNAAFDTAAAHDSPGVMVIWQDDPFDSGSDSELVETLVNRARSFGKPVVLVHGDTHVYRLGRPWGEAPNLIELETFALDNTDWWVEVKVDPAGPEVFSFEKEQS
jgi:hypothetical protein